MDAIAKANSSAFGSDVDTLKMIIMFCGVGLAVSAMCASCGLDLGPGFF